MTKVISLVFEDGRIHGIFKHHAIEIRFSGKGPEELFAWYREHGTGGRLVVNDHELYQEIVRQWLDVDLGRQDMLPKTVIEMKYAFTIVKVSSKKPLKRKLSATNLASLNASLYLRWR